MATKMYTVINGRETIVTKDNENKALRQIGKVLGLKIDYGGSAWTVKDDLGVSQEEAQKFIDAYFNAFPGKKSYFKEAIAQAWKDGYILINDVTRRRSWCDNFEEIKNFSKNYDKLSKEERSQYFKRKGSLERNALNFPVQGTAADMTKTACILAYNELEREGLSERAFIVALVHDEIVVECEDSLAEKVSHIVKEAMLKAGNVFCKTVPMKVDPIISKYWKK